MVESVEWPTVSSPKDLTYHRVMPLDPKQQEEVLHQGQKHRLQEMFLVKQLFVRHEQVLLQETLPFEEEESSGLQLEAEPLRV